MLSKSCVYHPKTPVMEQSSGNIFWILLKLIGLQHNGMPHAAVYLHLLDLGSRPKVVHNTLNKYINFCFLPIDSC